MQGRKCRVNSAGQGMHCLQAPRLAADPLHAQQVTGLRFGEQVVAHPRQPSRHPYLCPCAVQMLKGAARDVERLPNELKVDCYKVSGGARCVVICPNCTPVQFPNTFPCWCSPWDQSRAGPLMRPLDA
eukprot:259694-Chlamydomonas_euryale.AAC.6